jgi:hypothetical protein
VQTSLSFTNAKMFVLAPPSQYRSPLRLSSPFAAIFSLGTISPQVNGAQCLQIDPTSHSRREGIPTPAIPASVSLLRPESEDGGGPGNRGGSEKPDAPGEGP